MPMASIVSIVSRTDSPLFTDDDDTAKHIVSADSRLAAVSKLSRVRVESSKNSDTTVRPRSAGTLGMGRRPTSTKVSVRSSSSTIWSRSRSPTASRWRAVSTPVHGVHDFCSSPSSTPVMVTSTSSSRRVGRFLPT